MAKGLFMQSQPSTSQRNSLPCLPLFGYWTGKLDPVAAPRPGPIFERLADEDYQQSTRERK